MPCLEEVRLFVKHMIILKPEIDPFGSEAIKKCRLRAKLTSFPENCWRWLEKVPVESIADLAHHYWTCTTLYALPVVIHSGWSGVFFSYFGRQLCSCSNFGRSAISVARDVIEKSINEHCLELLSNTHCPYSISILWASTSNVRTEQHYQPS